MDAKFDQYADDYKQIINRVAHLTGETYEYFAELRVNLMKDRLVKQAAAQLNRILDFGCGVGLTEVLIRNAFPEAELFGFDESAESVKAAQELEIPRSSFLASNSATLPFEDAMFDVIYSNGTFHHIGHEKHAAILSELERVLRPGGHLFIFENNPYNPLMMRAMRKNPFDDGTVVVHPLDMRRKVKQSGLSLRKTVFYIFYPKWLKLLRPTERYLGWLPIGAQYYTWATK